MHRITQEYLEALFPPSKTEAFFEALFGDVEEGAYHIKLAFQKASDKAIHLAFELHGKPNKCLACNNTSGLPHVFARHPIINVQKLAHNLAQKVGWDNHIYTLEKTQQLSKHLHVIPFIILKN